MSKSRLFYIDNLRIFLISLVVLHHLIISYGAPGDWFYVETQAGMPFMIPMAMFVASNQAFFMGMFFFVSAYFIVPSLGRKGVKPFINERLLRLGIPLLAFYFIIFPFTIYLRDKLILGSSESFLTLMFSEQRWGFGPMWFVEALLVFTSIFLLFRSFLLKLKVEFPGTRKIILSALLIGTIQFLIRIELPVGWSQSFTSFQFPFFIQYIFLFILGIVAWQNKWMEQINTKMAWRWFSFAQVLIFVGFPVLFILGGAAETGTEKFMGGFTWQCFAYAAWEQLLGFSLIIGLFGIFKKRWNSQGRLASKLSASAYGVYVFHPPILIALNALFLNADIAPFLKFVILTPISLGACFLFAWLIKMIPGVKRIM